MNILNLYEIKSRGQSVIALSSFEFKEDYYDYGIAKGRTTV